MLETRAVRVMAMTNLAHAPRDEGQIAGPGARVRQRCAVWWRRDDSDWLVDGTAPWGQGKYSALRGPGIDPDRDLVALLAIDSARVVAPGVFAGKHIHPFERFEEFEIDHLTLYLEVAVGPGQVTDRHRDGRIGGDIAIFDGVRLDAEVHEPGVGQELNGGSPGADRPPQSSRDTLGPLLQIGSLTPIQADLAMLAMFVLTLPVLGAWCFRAGLRKAQIDGGLSRWA
jgi:hypothetical protein